MKKNLFTLLKLKAPCENNKRFIVNFLFIIISSYIFFLYAQEPTVTITGGNYHDQSLDFSGKTIPTYTYDLSDATAILVSGTWSSEETDALRAAIHNDAISTSFQQLTTNIHLQTADLSAMRFTTAWVQNDQRMQYLFINCTSLKSVILSDIYIDVVISFFYTFNNCSSLTDIVNLDKFTKVSNFQRAFYNCSSLVSVTLPEGSSYIYGPSFGNAFERCTSLTTVINLDKFNNTQNFSNIFSNCKSLTTVTLPEGTTSDTPVFAYAFAGCSAITTTEDIINFEKFTNIVTIWGIFSGCSSLKKIILPEGTTASSISFYNAFSACTSLGSAEDIINLDKFTNVSDFAAAFHLCSSLTGVRLPEGTSYTGGVSFRYTFSGCTSLNSTANIINFDKFTSISNFEYVFQDCSSLVDVTLPEGSTYTGAISFKNAFENCTLLPTVINLDKFTGISDFTNTFQNCSSLAGLILPEGTTAASISFNNTFNYCTSLITTADIINFEKFTNISTFEYVFNNCRSIKNITLPEGTTYTGNISFKHAFSNCFMVNTIHNVDKFNNVGDFTSTFSTCYSLLYLILGDITANSNTIFLNTFSTTNPNCLKYLPVGTVIPAAWSAYPNFIEGTSVQDSPRAYGDIVLVDYNISSRRAPYHCPLEFSIAPGYKAEYTRPFYTFSSDGISNFQSIVVPFDVESITGKTIRTDICAEWADSICYVKKYIGSNGPDMNFEYTDSIKSGIPYLIALKSGYMGIQLIFNSSDKGIKIPVTGSLTDTDPALNSDYKGTLSGTSGIAWYLKNLGGKDVFVKDSLPGSYSDIGNEAQPFRAFFIPSAGNGNIPFDTLHISWYDALCAEWIGDGRGTIPQTVLNGDDKYLWSRAENWIGGNVPLKGNSFAYHPSATELYVDGNRIAGRIENTTSAGLYVLPGSSLSLTEVDPLSQFNDLAPLVVKAASGQVNGTFLVPEGTKVNARVEFVTRAKSSDVSSEKNMNWQYFGIPVDSFPAGQMHGAYVREFGHTRRETHNDGSTSYIYWEWLDNNSVLTPFTGYEISVANSHNGLFTFSGNLLTTGRTIPVEYRDSDHFFGRWILSNPFTAALDITTDIDFGNDFEQAVYLFNTGSVNHWESGGGSGSVTGNAAGQYTVLTTISAGGRGGIIPSLQGFMVKMSGTPVDGQNYNLTLKYPSVARNSNMRSKDIEDTNEEELPYTDILLLSGDTIKDRVWLYTHTEATHSFDNGLDGRKIFGNSSLAQLYVSGEDGDYQLNALPDIDGTLIAFKAQVGINEYTLRFNHANSGQVYRSIILIDLHTGKQMDISSGGEYHFIATNEENASKRFLITTQNINAADNAEAEIRIFNRDGINGLINSSQEELQVSLYNISGKLTDRFILPAFSSKYLFTASYPTGVYLLEACNDTQSKKLVEKLIIY